MQNLLPPPSLRDVVDIIFLTIVAYQLYLWFKGTRALRVLIGLVVLGGIYSIAKLWGLFLTTWVFQVLWQVLVILLLILFQAEIRQVLEKVSLLRYLRSRKGAFQSTLTKDLARITFELAEEKTGALIVIERDDDPSEWLSAGQEIMALPEPTLIKSIFNRNVPVHDGALFLSQGRIAQMGCILPLSEREDIPKKYGTRHRAALGLTEQTDALCLVVSEETGEVSTAVGGILTVWNDPKLLASRLNDLLKISELPGPTLKGLFRAAVLENWGPKLIALALVAIAWMALVTQQNIKTTVIAQIQYMNIPRGLVLAKDSANSVKLTLSGRRYNIRSLENHEVGVQVDLAESPVGTQQKRLSARNIDLPLGINIEQVTPQEIKITLKTSEKGYRPEPPLSEAYP